MKIGTQGEKGMQITNMTVTPDYEPLKKPNKESPNSLKMENADTKVFLGILGPHFKSLPDYITKYNCLGYFGHSFVKYT